MVMHKIFAAGCAGLAPDQTMLKMHLTLLVAQHWFTIPLWLYLIGAINKSQLMDFHNLPTMRRWMEADWSKRAPKQLFSHHSSVAPGDMDKRKEVLNSINSPPAHLAVRRKVPAVASAPDAWANLPHSAKTGYIARYMFLSCLLQTRSDKGQCAL